MNYKILGANSIYIYINICDISFLKSGCIFMINIFMMLIPQKEESKNICIYVNSSIILCYSSTVRHSRPLGTQPLRHSQSLDRESP